MYTRQQHLEMAQLLRKAKRYLWRGDRNGKGLTGVCAALAKASRIKDTPEARGACRRLHFWISSSMGRYGFVGDWLKRKGFASWETPNKDIQAYRLRWMDQMIEILEAE